MNPVLTIILILLTFCVIIGLWSLVEPFILDITTIRLNPASKCSKFDSIAGKDSTPGINTRNVQSRVFFFSDLHAEFCMISSARLLKAIDRANRDGGLDAVIFGGDIISWTPFRIMGIRYLRRISDGCQRLGIPFIGVSGNHDCHMTAKDIASCGFINLETQPFAIPSRYNSRTTVFSGLDDSGRESRTWLQQPSTADGCTNVLVVHDPDALLHFSSYKEGSQVFDYALAGHLHGGQLRLPFNFVFKVIRKDELPMIGVIDGVFAYKGTSVFISRGIGCGTLPIRFLCRPEASIVEIGSSE